MLRKDVLFDSRFGIVKVWDPETQFLSPVNNAPMPAVIKVVVVEPWAGRNLRGQVVQVRPFELRLRGFHMEDAIKTIPPDENDGGMAILHDLLQEEKHEKRDELLSQYILKLRDREMNRRAALLRTRRVASICRPVPIRDEHAQELFWSVWDAVEPEDAPVPRMKDLLYIAQMEIAELKSERVRLRTTLQAAVTQLDALREE